MPDTELRNRGVTGAVDSQAAEHSVSTTDTQTPMKTNLSSILQSSTLSPQYSSSRIFLGWMVHLYTATGVLVNFYAILSAFIITPDFHLFAKLNWLAILIDATDGTFARAIDIKKVIPNFDGALMDNIIDFQTFSLLPALAIVRFQIVSNVALQYMLSSAILISSAYAFCQTMAKTSEAFVGFPSYWNIVVCYLYYLDAPPLVSAFVILVCAILSFIPIHFIYPTKTKTCMSITLTGAYIWGCMMLFPCLFPSHRLVKPVLNLSLIYVVYYICMSLYLDNLRRKRGE